MTHDLGFVKFTLGLCWGVQGGRPREAKAQQGGLVGGFCQSPRWEGTVGAAIKKEWKGATMNNSTYST